MGSDLQYILDANVFIEAYKRYYAFDLCPGFWRSIEHCGCNRMNARRSQASKEGSSRPEQPARTAASHSSQRETSTSIA